VPGAARKRERRKTESLGRAPDHLAEALVSESPAALVVLLETHRGSFDSHDPFDDADVAWRITTIRGVGYRFENESASRNP